MKKTLILILSSLLLISGCSKKSKVEKIDLIKGRIIEKQDNVENYYKNITETKLENLLTNPSYNTFILYYFDSSCSGCQDFKPILNQAIIDYDLEIYGLEATSLPSSSSFIQNGYSTPSLFVYEDGALKKDFSLLKNEEAFTSKKGFENFLNTNFIMPKVFFIDENMLDEKRKNNEKFVVEYIQQSCGQCSKISDIFLNDYIRNNMKNKKFYLIDKEDILSPIKDDDKNDYWTSFKIENGFCETWENGEINKYGLGSGWTPTFQYWEGSTLINAAHPFATYDATKGEIVRKYYEDDLEIGTKFEDKAAYQSATSDFYAQKLKEFLDLYL